MLTDMIHEITHELTPAKIIVGLIAYGIIHGTYRLMTRLEQAIIHEAATIIHDHHKRTKSDSALQDLL